MATATEPQESPSGTEGENQRSADRTDLSWVLKAWEYGKNAGKAVLLLAVYAVVLFLAFISLSAHEVQTRIATSTIDGRPANIYDVLRATPEIPAAETSLMSLEERRRAVGANINDLNDQRNAAKTERDRPAIDAWRFFPVLGLEMTDEVRQNPPLGMPSFSNQRGNQNFTPEMEKILVAYEAKHAEVIRINREKDRQNELRVQLDEKVAQRRDDLQNMIARSLPHLRSELDFFKVNSTRGWVSDGLKLFGLVTAIEEQKTTSSDLSEEQSPPEFILVGLPSVMLMIFIAIVGGALGGLIRVTETYLSVSTDPEETARYFIARPLYGILMGLTVFVLLKAGVLLVSGVAPGGAESAALNAYFVAFASIVAGLMSEHAVDKIRSAGKSFLSKDTLTNASYASGVVDQMVEQNKSVDELYSYFAESRDTVDGWLSEQIRVPAYAKQLISAWLGASPRVLFTDSRAAKTADVDKTRRQ